jgi:hypothetical protein
MPSLHRKEKINIRNVVSFVPFKLRTHVLAWVEAGLTWQEFIQQEKHTFKIRKDMIQILIYYVMYTVTWWKAFFFSTGRENSFVFNMSVEFFWNIYRNVYVHYLSLSLQIISNENEMVLWRLDLYKCHSIQYKDSTNHLMNALNPLKTEFLLNNI